jgi:hypothetical protein
VTIGWLARRRAAKQAAKRAAAQAAKRAAAQRSADAWAPQLGSGSWRVWYGECCDALLAYDKIANGLPEGALRERLANLRDDVVATLDRAQSLAELGAFLDPDGPVRDRVLVHALATDPLGDLTDQLGPVPTERLRDALLAVRDDLLNITDDAARLAVQLRENPQATDVAEWLKALAAGIAAARKAAWIPIGYREP